MCYCYAVVLLLIHASIVNGVIGFTLRNNQTSRTSPTIELSQVQSNADITSLADLRYQEWILKDDASSENNQNANVPSRTSFRLATAEIYHERSVDGATVFLARYHNQDDTIAVVGAAELSPIETRGCIHHYNIHAQEVDANSSIAMYATDVVTSSSYRRLGIGSQLMNGLEVHAFNLGCRFLFLHVEYENVAAIDFYHRLGYMNVDCGGIHDDGGVVSLSFANEGIIIVPIKMNSTTLTAPDEQIHKNKSITVRTNQLAINAGTLGQLLMVKQVKSSKDNGVIQGYRHGLRVNKAATGFGKGRGRSRSKKNNVETKS